jgi:uncharacterized protein (TIGR03086 family)
MAEDVRRLFRRAAEEFGRRVHDVKDDQWGAPTPCTEWDVRALVNHLVYEMRWAPPLFAGQTVAEVGDRYEGDLLGDDPKAAWDDAARDALAAVESEGAMERTVHLSFGDFPGREYTMQLFADLLIHGWDLARGSGQDDRLDPELVRACAAWFSSGMEEVMRSAGVIGARVETDGDEQARLLAAYGRSPR